MAFTHPITVRFQHVDSAGIVFFSRVFEFCHEAFEALLEAMDMPLPQLLETEGWGLPVVSAHADYSRPMKLGEHLDIDCRVQKMGRSSLTFGFQVSCEGSIRAEVQVTHAAVALDGFRVKSLPEQLINGLTQLGLDLPERGT
jgi:4-hydroxybenzoyl-CoA thioesterase